MCARVLSSIFVILACAMSSTAQSQSVSPPSTVGPSPQLVKPESSLVPTVNIAPATGWPEKKSPAVAHGLSIAAFASDLDHPRWLYALPNGDVLVAETNAPERPNDGSGIKGWVMRLVMNRAGAGVKSANRITLLRDSDGDGLADVRTAFLEGLNSPFGMTLVGNELFVANTDAIIRFPYVEGQTQITESGKKVADLPAGPINHHWTKNILASSDGSKIYATVGSNSNVAENGIENEEQRAAILEIDRVSGASRIYASGLRNPNGMAWQPETGELWTVVNERDELGNDLVPDYMTSVKDGGFYGWPYSYFGQNIDLRLTPQRPDLVRKAIEPDYALGAHTASLGLVFQESHALSSDFSGGAFVTQHGSWNRKPMSGYKVVFVPFKNGKPSGMPVDVVTGFVNERGQAMGRPVGIAIEKSGSVLVADDVGNKIWKVTPAGTLSTNTPVDEPPKDGSNTTLNANNGSEKSRGSLSEELRKNEGVITPPNSADGEIRKPTPKEFESEMPVLPPPGETGGDQSVQPR
jgi:glucose/arabinose dehydrogenase